MDEPLKTTPTENTFKTKDGLRIAYRSWNPFGAPRALVLIVPGFNSHSDYYQWAAEQFVADGLGAYAIDLRGRGKSDGERFYVKSFADYTSDVAGLLAIVERDHPGLEVYLLGHSAGGVVGAILALEHPSKLAGFICASFAYQVPAPDFAIAALKGLSHLAPHAHVLALNNKDFSRDPKIVAKMDADPLIAHESQTTSTVAELARADDRLKREFGHIALPLLIIHGTADKATKPAGSQFFFDTAGAKDKTLRLYDGHFHDMLNDIGKEKVMEDIIGWIDTRVK